MKSQQQLDVLDPFGVADTFCEKLVRIEEVGSARRLIFATTRSTSYSSECIAVAHIVLTAEAFEAMRRIIANFDGQFTDDDACLAALDAVGTA